MKATSGPWADAVRQPHQRITRVEVWRQGVLIEPDLGITGGSVVFDLGSETHCSATVACSDLDYLPQSELDPLTPYGSYLRIHSGLIYQNGVEELLLLATVPIVKVPTFVEGEAFEVECESWLRWVQDDVFHVPYSPARGATAKQAIAALVGQSVPWAVLDQSAATDVPVPVGMVWDDDRLAAVIDLAAMMGCIVRADAEGRIVVAPEPIPTDADDWSSARVVDASDVGTLLSGSRPDIDRAERFNGVFAINPDQPSISAWARETTGRVAWGGPFGRKAYVVEDQSLTSVGQAQALATKTLRDFEGRSRVIEVGMVPDASIEVGDKVLVRWPDGLEDRTRVRRTVVPLGLEPGELELRGVPLV